MNKKGKLIRLPFFWLNKIYHYSILRLELINTPTAGIVFAKFSVPAPCFMEEIVVLLPVPIKGLTTL